MKENTQQNEDFVALHEKMEKDGCDPKTMAGREAIFAAVAKKFTLGGQSPRHTYRAWVARLADPKKYGGRFSERMKKFQLNRTQKTTEAAPVVAVKPLTAVEMDELGDAEYNKAVQEAIAKHTVEASATVALPMVVGVEAES